MKHLYFIRHGLSEMNVAKQRSGLSNTPLTPTGREQAKAAGKKARDEGIVFDIILASPLDRAHETAKHFADQVGYDHANIVLDERLIERGYGELEGKVDTHEVTEGMKTGEHFIDRYDDVEPLVDMQRRADEVIAHVMTLDHETILLVSHGAFGRALHRSANNIPIEVVSIRHDNAKLHKLI